MEVFSGKYGKLSIFKFDFEEVLNNDWDCLRLNKIFKRPNYTLNDSEKITGRYLWNNLSEAARFSMRPQNKTMKIGLHGLQRLFREPKTPEFT